MLESNEQTVSVSKFTSFKAVAALLIVVASRTASAQVISSPVATASFAAQSVDAQSQSYQLKVKVQRVFLDVVVTDVDGNPVAGLKQEDFKVMEDGVAQPLRSFDALTAATSSSSQGALDLHLPLDTFSNFTMVSPDKPVTVVLFDMLHTPQDALPYAHRELVRFIKDRKDSAQIAIFVLTDRLHMLQGFTDNETQLLAAINSKKATTQSLTLRNAPFAKDASPALFEAEIQELVYQTRKRNQSTVDAFTEIARFVSAAPGRKSLIWMSGSFPPDIFSIRPPSSDALINPDIRAAQNLLQESRVAVYPVDVRGLQADPQYNPDGLQGLPVLNYFGRAQWHEHVIMDEIAERSGGRAFYSTNGLKEAMETVERQGSEYYTLTYAPSNRKQDGSERKIRVVLSNPTYQLSYRTRYLAPDEGHPIPIRPLAMDTNMQHGSPNSTELFFEAKVVPVGGAVAATADENQEIEKFSQVVAKQKRAKNEDRKPMVQHYDINFAVVGRQLEMPAVEEGQYATNLKFGLAAYSPDSVLLNGTEVVFKSSISEEQHQRIESEGYHASMVFTVPVGAVSLRLAVRDEIGQRIGTLEIPLPVPVVQNAASSGTP